MTSDELRSNKLAVLERDLKAAAGQEDLLYGELTEQTARVNNLAHRVAELQKQVQADRQSTHTH